MKLSKLSKKLGSCLRTGAVTVAVAAVSIKL